MFDIENIRADFPILGRTVHGRPLVYLDNAATAQKPLRVIGATSAAYLRSNGNIHRGAHTLADEATELYESARDTVAGFIGAAHREEVVFTSGATASLNIAARGLCELLVGDGDNIVVGGSEHHSNIVPWQIATGGAGVTGKTSPRGVEIRVLPFSDEGVPELDKLESLIDERTRVLAITHCSNVLGVYTDTARATEIAHRHGVVVVVDGCQGVVHGGGPYGGSGRVNVAEMDCDFYAFSGHKLYAPLGIGVLYGKKHFFERMPPVLGGGSMVKSVFFEETPPKKEGVDPKKDVFAGHTAFEDLPFRFEAGTPNYVGAVGLAEAIKYLEEFDPADIARHEQSLLEAATAGLSRIEGLHIYGTAAGKAPIVSFTVEGIHAYDLGALLDGQGIAVRTGSHCAQPLVRRYGVESMCRASFALYNTPGEVDALVGGVEKAVKMLRR
ncbi:MAG: aminotransferase class V-fold PLP-dependent enzyme [Alistipes sp.]|nr:aminotransferase class V-fold PLP-dependent enzyme [Alistipes sp.]